ncbi:MAG: murein transglycosylase A, partial [Nodosilinea sp.]
RGLAIIASLTTMAGALSPGLQHPLVAPHGSALQSIPEFQQSLVWAELEWPSQRSSLLQAINHSLTYLASPKAAVDYQNPAIPGLSRDRLWRSLQRLRDLVQTSPDRASWQAALQREFQLYQAIGQDGQGTVAFTGYFEPHFRASPVATAEYPYPLYRRPPDLDIWPRPHPTRLDLEGINGLAGGQGPLAGLELVWLANRLEAFLVQVQGSAQLDLPDGRVMAVGYAGRTDYPYTSIGRALVEDGKIAAADLSLPRLVEYFATHPADLDSYLPRNQRFIFFRETSPGAPIGSLRVPVTAGYSIATDKSLMPPGAIALIQLALPQRSSKGAWVSRPTTRLVLDQDTGGAIVGPGRVDLFVGSGVEAGEMAGRINTSGRLFYLLLKP